MLRKRFTQFVLLLFLIPLCSWSQETYMFDQLLVYETMYENKDKRGYITSQLINSKDNSYYALLKRNPKGGVELFFEHKGIGKYAYIDLAVNLLTDGDEVRIKKRLLKRLRNGGKAELVWQQARDTVIMEKTYTLLSLDPGNAKDRTTQPLQFLLDKEDPDFQTNFWTEFSMETWEASRSLPGGQIAQMFTYNPFGYMLSRTNLKSQKPMSIRLVVE